MHPCGRSIWAVLWPPQPCTVPSSTQGRVAHIKQVASAASVLIKPFSTYPLPGSWTGLPCRGVQHIVSGRPPRLDGRNVLLLCFPRQVVYCPATCAYAPGCRMVLANVGLYCAKHRRWGTAQVRDSMHAHDHRTYFSSPVRRSCGSLQGNQRPEPGSTRRVTANDLTRLSKVGARVCHTLAAAAWNHPVHWLCIGMSMDLLSSAHLVRA